jgi:hypothetical protein
MTDAKRHSMSFTAVEEEFFRAGAAMSESSEPVDTFSDLEQAPRPSFWQRVFGRKR